jgi:hypothetical protein
VQAHIPSFEPRAEGSQPAIESTQHQSPALSTSQKLWNAAYDKVEEDNAKLVGSYIQTLANILKTKASEESISDADHVAAELKDPSKRQTYMKMLVEEGHARFVKASRITEGVGRFAKAILAVKPIMDLVIQNIPQAAPAALPWGGVCVGLQVSIHHCIVLCQLISLRSSRTLRGRRNPTSRGLPMLFPEWNGIAPWPNIS